MKFQISQRVVKVMLWLVAATVVIKLVVLPCWTHVPSIQTTRMCTQMQRQAERNAAAWGSTSLIRRPHR
ncbi:MAG TPA: hypothetical protein VFF69_06210 [Phycisphaerales bacterium]|nr:hypothetical protein [Phycisphaerales bacterium]